MKKTFVIYFLLLNTINFYELKSQDSVFVYPSMSDLCVEVQCNINENGIERFFCYSIKSLNCSKQSVWQFRIQKRTEKALIFSPKGWNSKFLQSIYNSSQNLIRWSSDSSSFDIKPNSNQSGFSIKSEELPGICKYYVTGYVDLPEFDVGNEPSQIIRNDIFKNSLTGKTIAPRSVESYDFLMFLDTLIFYCDQSFALSWIRSKQIFDKYSIYLSQAAHKLVVKDTNTAHFNLFRVLKNVNIDSSSGITTEAYFLLKLNTEFLMKQLPELRAEEMFKILLEYIDMFYEEGEITKKGVYNSLRKKIENSEKKFLEGKVNASSNILEAFKNEVEAQRAKSISENSCQVLIDYADFILSVIGE